MSPVELGSAPGRRDAVCWSCLLGEYIQAVLRMTQNCQLEEIAGSETTCCVQSEEPVLGWCWHQEKVKQKGVNSFSFLPFSLLQGRTTPRLNVPKQSKGGGFVLRANSPTANITSKVKGGETLQLGHTFKQLCQKTDRLGTRQQDRNQEIGWVEV